MSTEQQLSDEERRKLLKPNPSNEEMIALVQANYCKPGDDNSVEIVKELDSYDDKNYWMKISGVEHLVKIHNGVESGDACRAIAENKQDSVIHFQYAMMKALKDNKITASYPVHLEEENKKPFVTSLPVVSKEHSPCQLVVTVYTWVQGIPMSSLKVGWFSFTFTICVCSSVPSSRILFCVRYCHWNVLPMRDNF